MLDNTGTEIEIRSNIGTIAAQRDTAIATYAQGLEELKAALATLQKAKSLARSAARGKAVYLAENDEKYAKQIDIEVDPDKAIIALRRKVDAAIWRRVFDDMRLSQMMDSQTQREFLSQIASDPIEATEENLEATISHLLGQSEFMFMQSVVNSFSRLDRRFASHNGFKFGNRIIMENMFDDWGIPEGDWSEIQDVERVFCVMEGKPARRGELERAVRASRQNAYSARQSTADTDLFHVKCFKKGSMHIYFRDKELLARVNRKLAEFYGEVLPDAATDGTDGRVQKGTAVSKDLQFYWTPDGTADHVASKARLYDGLSVLEPSAGNGQLVKAILRKAPNAKIDAIEYDQGRAGKILDRLTPEEAENVSVRACNFLTYETDKRYDRVVMNPPFYGTHWMAHVQHAYDLLKHNGHLIAILPVTAQTGTSKEHATFHAWLKKVMGHRAAFFDSQFELLPAASFAEAGTNVSTVVLTIYKGW